jgi:hypothetical protein
VPFASLKIVKNWEQIVKNGKYPLIYETVEEVYWWKFSLKLLKLSFLAGEITKKN